MVFRQKLPFSYTNLHYSYPSSVVSISFYHILKIILALEALKLALNNQITTSVSDKYGNLRKLNNTLGCYLCH